MLKVLSCFFAAMVSFKEIVENLEGVDKHTEILVRLLSVLPGWAEKNVQVTRESFLNIAFINCLLWDTH